MPAASTPASDDTDNREKLSRLVRERRQELGLSVREAVKKGGLARGTWESLEQGKRRTADNNYSSIERALDWAPGSVQAILNGDGPTVITVTDQAGASDTMTTPSVSERDQLIISIMERDDISDEQKAEIAGILIAQREAAERAREESARRLVNMFRRDTDA